MNFLADEYLLEKHHNQRIAENEDRQRLLDALPYEQRKSHYLSDVGNGLSALSSRLWKVCVRGVNAFSNRQPTKPKGQFEPRGQFAGRVRRSGVS